MVFGDRVLVELRLGFVAVLLCDWVDQLVLSELCNRFAIVLLGRGRL